MPLATLVIEEAAGDDMTFSEFALSGPQSLKDHLVQKLQEAKGNIRIAWDTRNRGRLHKGEDIYDSFCMPINKFLDWLEDDGQQWQLQHVSMAVAKGSVVSGGDRNVRHHEYVFRKVA